ncbi:MAG: hypothetical protein ABL891_03125 [Burkholderiales bacterium]
MRDVIRRIRSAAVAFAIVVFCAPAFSADPLTLLLLRVIRDKMISAGIESAVERAGAPANRSSPASAAALPGVTFGLDDAQLRQLINEGFVHLTPSQRDEVHASVRSIIADPKNAADVPAIIADLAIKASAVRQAHEQINALSFDRKRRIAVEARDEYEKMPLETREQMASVLRQRLVPLPADLTDMILVEFDRVRARTIPTPPVATIAPTASAAPTAPATPVSTNAN